MTVLFRCRIEKPLLDKANRITKRLGTSTSEMVCISVTQMARTGRVPLKLDTGEDSGVQGGVGVLKRVRAGQFEGAIKGAQAATDRCQLRPQGDKRRVLLSPPPGRHRRFAGLERRPMPAGASWFRRSGRASAGRVFQFEHPGNRFSNALTRLWTGHKSFPRS